MMRVEPCYCRERISVVPSQSRGHFAISTRPAGHGGVDVGYPVSLESYLDQRANVVPNYNSTTGVGETHQSPITPYWMLRSLIGLFERPVVALEKEVAAPLTCNRT